MIRSRVSGPRQDRDVRHSRAEPNNTRAKRAYELGADHWCSAVVAGEDRSSIDLIEDDDARWEAVGGQRLVGDALAAIVGPNRNVGVATKMLHLKRPRLFPILDKLVVEMLTGGISQDATADVRAGQAAGLVACLRLEGRANLHALRASRRSLQDNT